MTLHDRIMALPKRTPGQHDVVVKAASMATEADELMAEMASVIDSPVGMYALKHCDDAMKSDECHEACELLERYSTYKEGKQ